MPQEIETSRLVLRPMTPDDATALLELLGDAEVCRWQTFAPFETLAQARECIEAMTEELAQAEADAEEFRFGIYQKETQLLVGEIGIEYDEDWDAYELGCSLNRCVWQQGYASEAVNGLLRFAQEQHGIRDFFALIAEENAASRHLAARCGFARARAGEFCAYDGRTLAAAYYTLHL